jgi:hypothetical protein
MVLAANPFVAAPIRALLCAFLLAGLAGTAETAISATVKPKLLEPTKDWPERTAGHDLALKLDGSDVAWRVPKGRWGADQFGAHPANTPAPQFKDGMLRFDMPGTGALAFVNFPRNYGPGETVHIQFAYEMDQAFFDTFFLQADGKTPTSTKIFILGPRGSASSGDAKVVAQTRMNQKFPYLYTYWQGHTRNLEREAAANIPTGKRIILQPGGQTLCSWPEVNNFNGSAVPEGCVGFVPGKKGYVDVTISIGKDLIDHLPPGWNPATRSKGYPCHITAYLTYDGVRRKWFDADEVLQLTDAKYGTGIGQIWLGPYQTNKKHDQVTNPGYVAYGELIVSSKKAP